MKLQSSSNLYTHKPDYEITKLRFDAFWEREIIDRPLVQFSLYKSKNERFALPAHWHARSEETQVDVELFAKWHLIDLSHQLFLGDSLPIVCPGLGPAVMAAFYGCPLHFDQYGNSWNEPIVADFNGLECLTFNWESPWLSTLRHLTTACLNMGAGHFITGMSNWFTGADCLAAIFGSQNLVKALIQDPDWVKQALDRLQTDFEQLYLEFHKELSSAGQPGTTWLPLLSDGRYYVITNDFSIMTSTTLYRKLFLDGAIRECQYLDHSVYHLDGPDAVRHLDTILELEQLDGVHFIPSLSDASFTRWAGVYKRIQDAGKCLIVNCEMDEIDAISNTLMPEGLLLNVMNVTSIEEANDLLKHVEKWPPNGRV
jgi:hypothetical protein